MTKFSVFLPISLLLIKFGADGANILCLFPFPSRSHSVVFQTLILELAHRGHDLLVFTADPVREDLPPNYEQVHLSSINELKKAMKLPPIGTTGAWNTQRSFELFANDLVDEVYSHPVMSELMANNNHRTFDLVIVEWMMWFGLSGVSHKLSAPLIGITSLDSNHFYHYSVGNPLSAAYIPDMFLGYTNRMTFWERFVNVYYCFNRQHMIINHMEEQDAIARKHLGNDIPHVREMFRNVSLILSYTDPIIYYPRPTVPAIIEIAGLHLNAKRKPVKLPERMQSFLDEAENGFIYFSFGSTVPGSGMLDRTRKQFVQAFSELPYRVLWKWENETLLGKPDNVFVAKWLPQREILAHPNIRVFMYQGGLQSTEETIQHAVPVVGIPLFVDQHMNLKKLELAGLGKIIEANIRDLTKEDVKAALLKVIIDKGYKERMIEFRKIRNDKPEDALEKAVWWTEYVIRHKGARHLRIRGLDMPWYQLYLVDIIVFTLSIVCITSAILYIFARRVIRMLITVNIATENKMKTR